MVHKTDWKLKDTVKPEDLNRIEENNSELESPTFDDSGTVSDINSFTDFVNSVKSKMSIFDFFRNFKAGLKYIVHTGQIINTQDVTQEGFALDARQANPNISGSLGAKISDLNNNINSIERFTVTAETTLNDITEWLMNKFQTGLRSVNIYQGEKIVIFNQLGNFNIICTKFIAGDQFTGIAINHWDRNVYSVGIDASKSIKWEKLTINSDLPIIESHVVNPNGSDNIEIILNNYTITEKFIVSMTSYNVDVGIIGATATSGGKGISVRLTKNYTGDLRINIMYYKVKYLFRL